MFASPPSTSMGNSNNRGVAQTNLALYRQLHNLGYQSQSLKRIRGAYELAMSLFAGRFRACGRVFLAHLVGTAGILAELGASEPIVTAGLLHAAYEQGDFGFTRWRHRRERIRAVVGDDVENLIQRYDQLKWNETSIPLIFDRLNALQETDRAALLIRLANELDDHLDFARQLSNKGAHRVASHPDIIIAMAASLGHPTLAESLRHALTEPEDMEWLSPLCTGRSGSFPLAWRRGAGAMQVLRRIPFLRFLPF